MTSSAITAVSEESADTLKKAEAEKPATVHITSEVPSNTHGRHQRPSLIEFLTGGDLGRHAPKSASEQLIQQKGEVKIYCDLCSDNNKVFHEESSSSASYGSTPNQGNVSASDSHDQNANGSSTPCNVATGLNG